jgi:hypothetical protein
MTIVTVRVVWVVIARRPPDPVVEEQREVEEEADRVRTAPQPLQRALGHGHRRHARRAAEALLRAGVPEVDAHRVGVDLDAPERGDAVGHEQRVAPAHHRRELVERLARARRGLGVDDGDHPRLRAAAQRLLQPLGRDGLAVGPAHLDDPGSAAPRDLHDALAEEARTRRR